MRFLAKMLAADQSNSKNAIAKILRSCVDSMAEKCAGPEKLGLALKVLQQNLCDSAEPFFNWLFAM